MVKFFFDLRMRFGLLGALICLLVGCEKVRRTDEKNPVPKNAVRLLFTYSSEKEDWVKQVTASFNHGGYKTKTVKPIYVDAIAEGSGECIGKIINDSQKADLVSPASEVFVRLGNTEGRAKLGREVIGPTVVWSLFLPSLPRQLAKLPVWKSTI